MQITSLAQIQAALLSGELTAIDLVSSYLDRCAETKSHNAYVEIFEEEIKIAAQTLDEKIKNNKDKLGPLFGAVVSIKDNLCYKDHLVTASSKMLDGFVAPYSATIVERLIEADAMIIGRTNCDEFCMGSYNETSYYGPVKSAIDPTKVSGGSSGGGAVSVALGTCLVAIGSDTGGSIRQPAAYNGMVGYKATYGSISRWGLIAYGSSLDVIGFIAPHTEDITKVLTVVAGRDEYDSTSIDIPNAVQKEEITTLKIAYSSKVMNDPELKAELRQGAREYIVKLKAAGHELVDVDLKYEDYYVPTYYILACAEASSNLSRYDGIRYGHRSAEDVDDYKELIWKSRAEGFGSEVKKRIMLGTYVLSQGYYEAYFLKAQQVRTLIKEHTDELLASHDVLLMPVTTSLPKAIGEQKDPIQSYLSDRCTVLANLCGLPAISYPVYNIEGAAPLSMQLITASKQDNYLLAVSQALLSL